MTFEKVLTYVVQSDAWEVISNFFNASLTMILGSFVANLKKKLDNEQQLRFEKNLYLKKKEDEECQAIEMKPLKE